MPGIAEGLDDVVLKSLAAEREDRYQTAEELRQALSEVLNRHYSNCDVDRVAAFMREIFARELKLETQEYASFVRTDFSDVRVAAEGADTLSITDTMGLGETESVPLSDSDIHELEPRSPRRAWDQGPSQAALERAARERIDLVVGQRYRIERLLGVGGMGAVYEAKHLALGKNYALKILHDIYGRDPDIIDRFMREARAATQTGHPNIIDVTDIGTMETGDLYFVMELLEGTPLSSVVVQEGPLSVRRAVHIATQICRALGAAHEAGIIHRDLKSENVILTARGQDPDFVKVLDFGICRQVDATNSARTTPGMVMGSPDYMAPEQAAGVSATAASDVYALGIILFEMLAAQLPFQGRNAIDVLMQKAARGAPRLDTLRPELPVALGNVVARCLEREPALRIKSMRELEYELTRAVDGRATAVAAMIGLSPSRELTPDPSDPFLEPSAMAGASAGSESLGSALVSEPALPHPAAASQAGARMSEDDDPDTEVYAVQGEMSATVSATSFEPEEAAFGPRHRAWLMLRTGLLVTLGGVVVGSGMWLVTDDRASESEPGAAEPVPVPARRPVATPPAAKPRAVVPSVEPPAPAKILEDQPTQAPADLVESAKAALAREHWQEPANGSLALALANLALIDPGNEELAKLRRQAAKTLKPRGDKAFAAQRWEQAAASYRDLLRVWPEHDVRTDLVAALRKHGRQLRRRKSYEASLAVADELLNLQADDFSALRLRADSLAGLSRWEHATAAYREAMRVRPSNKDVRRAYWRARKRSKRGD
ncbi:MAG: hypothetical protein B7733_12655 [Myxococcales bacterium FL481]|nr:MAG: hypothetical protein B7733_12655 [Myxococcales bacterium FL481]